MLLQAHVAHAQLPRWSDPDLARFSRVIVSGRVSAIAYGRDPAFSDAIYTYIEIDVNEVAKGWVPGSRIVVKQLGGRVGDLELVVGDQATFRVGEETLLFLEVRPRDGTLYTTALWQGKWEIRRDAATGDPVAVRQFPAPRVARRPPSERPGATPDRNADEEVRLLRPFMAELRSWSGPDSRRPSGERINLNPREATAAGAGAESSSLGDASVALLGPARWHEADTGIAVRVDVATGGQPGLSGNGFREISSARALWNDSGSTLSLVDGGTRSTRCFNSYEGDGRLSIAFMDPCDEIDDSGGTLAIGGFYSSYAAAAQETVNGTVFRKILQAMVIANGSPTALSYLQNSGCFQDILTHEIGHTVGLGHTSAPGNIMQPFINNSCFEVLPDGSGRTAPLGLADLASIRFVYAAAVLPGTPELGSPSGSIGDANPDYVWDAVPDAERYQLQVIRTGVQSISSAVYDATAICSGGSCSVSSPPVPTLESGDHIWHVRALSGAGTGPWSAFVSFSVAASAPAVPTLGGLSGSIVETTPTYSWNEVGGATRYQLHVIQVGVRSVYSGVHEAAVICGGGVCNISSPPGPTLVPGEDYLWRVRGFNAAGSGAWSSFVLFSVAGGVPTAPLLIGPSGGINDTAPTYTWNETAGATRYQLHIIEVGERAIHSVLYSAPRICSGGTCSVASPPVAILKRGSSYVWRVRGLNASGSGAWSPFSSFNVR